MNWCFESLLWVHCLLSSYNILFLSECLLIKLQNFYQFHHINYRFVSLTTLLHTKQHVNFFDVISLFFCRHFLLHRARYLSFSFSQTQNIRTILTTAWTLSRCVKQQSNYFIAGHLAKAFWNKKKGLSDFWAKATKSCAYSTQNKHHFKPTNR